MSQPTPPDRPALRALDATRVDSPRPGYQLSDRLGLSQHAFVPMALVPIVRRLDGSRSVERIQQEVATELGEPVELEFVQSIVRQLDDLHLLLGPAFDRVLEAAAAAFLAGGVRPARHAGSAGYPAEPVALRTALRAMVRGPSRDRGPLRGLVAPHIDLARGHDGYRAAYERLLAAPPAELYVLFGTGHAGPTAPVTGLPLDWQTPLGRVASDQAFVAAVHERIGAASPADLLHHRDEHSLEFQVLLLQHLHEQRAAKTPFEVAAFLCGQLPSADGDPLHEPYVQQLLAAFTAAAQQSGKRICYLAGADLAHIGPLFGDGHPIGDARLATLATSERSNLQHLIDGEPGAFHRAIECRDNPDRVCSAPAITLCASLAGGGGELLHYGQARADDGSQTVSFCAMAFAGGARSTSE